jgi:hypothetical protein
MKSLCRESGLFAREDVISANNSPSILNKLRGKLHPSLRTLFRTGLREFGLKDQGTPDGVIAFRTIK